jgi:hypothetical protein
MNIQTVIKAHARELLRLRNVVAVGKGYKVSGGTQTNKPCIVVSVSRKLPLGALAAVDLVPKAIDGVVTDVVETGEIRALNVYTDRYRPIPLGVSIGHREITAGTLGALVRDKKTRQQLMLSNNHVFANSNDAQAGDAILQPGPHDGGAVGADTAGRLTRFVEIQFGAGGAPDFSNCPVGNAVARFFNLFAWMLRSSTRLAAIREEGANRVDAAVAEPTEQVINQVIDQIDGVRGVADYFLGMPIWKTGRTTGRTMGEILQTDVTVNVSYGDGRVATFTDQLMAGAMSQGGDSGSAVVDQDNKFVGLLFAGSDSTTIFSPAQFVLDELEVEMRD